MEQIESRKVKKRKRKNINAKKISIILLSIASLFAVFAVIIHFTTRVTNESYADCAVGDINGDGKINSADAVLIIKHISGNGNLFDNQIKNADVNSDGTVNSIDALLILRYATNDISSIPYNEQQERLLNSSLKRKVSTTSNGFTSTAQIVNEWDNNDGTFSYQVNITIRNDSDTDSGTWKAAVVFDKDIHSTVNCWGCNPFVENKSITVGGESIDAGESAECGFIITASKDLSLIKLTVR